MAYNPDSVVTLGILKDAMTRLRTDYTGAIANADHVTTDELNTAIDTALDTSLGNKIATAEEANEMFDEVLAP